MLNNVFPQREVASLTTVAPLVSEPIGALTTIVNLVRTGDAVTRPQLGRVSALGRSIVTQRVEQAIALGLLEDGELGPSTGGRAPRRLRFRSERGRFVAVEFGALHVGIAIFDLGRTLLNETHESWDIAVGPDESLRFVADRIEQLIAESGPAEIWGIGVGVPGPVEFTTGRPMAPPIMPGWGDYDIRGWFQARFGAPVFVDNDVNLMALGEFETIAESPTDDVLYVKIGSGIGAGLISGGRIHRGANGAAGDVGHTAVSQHTEVVCRCGQIGCLEAVAGGWALARDAEAKAGQSPFLSAILEEQGRLQPTDIVRGALNRDALSIGLIARSGGVVGEMLATLVNFFNPSIVVVGGSIAETGDLFLAAVRQTVYHRSLPLATRDLRIVPASSPGRREGVVGAARLVAERLFHPEILSSWLLSGSPRSNIAATYVSSGGAG